MCLLYICQHCGKAVLAQPGHCELCGTPFPDATIHRRVAETPAESERFILQKAA